jgi:hypothetical protein
MTYGHRSRASAENHAATERAVARGSGTWGDYQAWRQLDPDSRFALIQQALKPANDIIDEFPLAL